MLPMNQSRPGDAWVDPQLTREVEAKTGSDPTESSSAAQRKTPVGPGGL